MKPPETSRDMLDSLTPNELAVLRRRFGIEDHHPANPASDDDDDSGGMPPSNSGSDGGGGGGAPAPAVPPEPRRKAMH